MATVEVLHFRMIEGAGFFQHAAFLRTTVVGRLERGEADGLVSLGGS